MFKIDKLLNFGRKNIKKFLSQRNFKTQNILDIGAGGGTDLDIAKSIFPNAKLYACEGHPPYQAILKNKNIEVAAIDIEHHPFPYDDNTFDVIICNQILEHVKEIWWIMHEITRVLKPNGSLIVGVPNLASLHNRFFLAFGKQPSTIRNNSAHVRGYTKNDFIAILDSAFPKGYKLENFYGGNFYPFPPAIANPLAKVFPTMAVTIFLHFRKAGDYTNEFLVYPPKHKLETLFYLGENVE